MPRTLNSGWMSPAIHASKFEVLVDELGHCHWSIENAQIDPWLKGGLDHLYQWRDTVLYDLKQYRVRGIQPSKPWPRR